MRKFFKYLGLTVLCIIMFMIICCFLIYKKGEIKTVWIDTNPDMATKDLTKIQQMQIDNRLCFTDSDCTFALKCSCPSNSSAINRFYNTNSSKDAPLIPGCDFGEGCDHIYSIYNKRIGTPTCIQNKCGIGEKLEF